MADKTNYKKNYKKKNKTNNTTSLKKQVERAVKIPTATEIMPHRGFIEYNMPRAIAESILSDRKGKEKGSDPQKYLCDFVNEQYHMIGYCLKVIVS